MNELKPCPFCGSNRISVEYLYFRPYILCEKCHAQIPCYNTYPKAKEAWNRRDENVAPVVHGHRVDDGGFYARCSQCDGVLTLCANYCPNCGAKMDGGADHEAD